MCILYIGFLYTDDVPATSYEVYPGLLHASCCSDLLEQFNLLNRAVCKALKCLLQQFYSSLRIIGNWHLGLWKLPGPFPKQPRNTLPKTMQQCHAAVIQFRTISTILATSVPSQKLLRWTVRFTSFTPCRTAPLCLYEPLVCNFLAAFRHASLRL